MFFIQSIIFSAILLSSFFTVSISVNKKNDLKYIPQHQPLTLIGQHVPQLPACPSGLTYSPKYYRCMPNYVSAPAHVPAVAEIEIQPTFVAASHPNPYAAIASPEIPVLATVEVEQESVAPEIELQLHEDPMTSLAELLNLVLIKFDRIEMKLDVAVTGVNALSQVMVQVLPQLAQTCQVNGDGGFASFLPFFDKMDSDQQNAAAALQSMLDHKMFEAFDSEDSQASFSDKMDSTNDNEKQTEKIENKSTENDQKQPESLETSTNDQKNTVNLKQNEQLRKEQELWRNILEKIRLQISRNSENLKSKIKSKE